MDVIKIHPSDNVAVALRDINKDEELTINSAGKEISIKVIENIARGHKLALGRISAGEDVIKYGNVIAVATSDIPAGSWVHTHNVRTGLSENEEYSYDHKVYPLPSVKSRTFKGFRRKNGKAAIRNELWIIPIVGCVNGVADKLVRDNLHLVRGSIDGLYAFKHPFGCSQLGDDLKNTAKVLTDLVDHPNAGGVLVLGLGCENLTLDIFKEALGDHDPDRVKFLICQDVRDEYAEGSALLKELSDHAAGYKREDIPASELVIGLKCGGSDGLSGITANPTVGRFSDKLIAMGGTSILTEVPEMFGAESILFDRCESDAVFNKAVSMVDDFKKYFVSHGQVVYENPSPGNKAGGITTLEDKSCGCVQKGGSAQIVDVLKYGDTVKKKGLNLLSGPGNDLVSATDLTCAGAHMILFTTGRGTPFGAPAPTVKISTNSALFNKKSNWIDFNSGTVAENETIESASDRLLDLVLEIAGGKKTRSEENDIRDISIFKDGVVL